MKIKNVISLFDGMSCGQLALNRSGIEYENYFASEIDKHAISVTKSNFPETIHVGSVVDLSFIDGYLCTGSGQSYFIGEIDLIIGGSPCQNFSFAGTRKGMVTKDNIEILSLDQYLELKSSGFEFQGESFLFWEYVRILKETGAKKFVLENVKMNKKWSCLISSILGFDPIEINSSLVSAQNRRRLYWTNIPNIKQPEDKGILLKDIIESGYVDREKSLTLTTRTNGASINRYFEKSIGQMILDNRCCILDTSLFSNPEWGAVRGRYDENRKIIQKFEPNKTEKSNCLTTVQKDTVVAFKEIKGVEKIVDSDGNVFWRVPEATKKGYVDIKPGDFVDLTFIKSKTRRGRKMEDKSNCLTATSFDYCQATEYYFRKLTPIECERLQTVPDNYTSVVSNSQRYKMLGNGWTIDVISHILNNLK